MGEETVLVDRGGKTFQGFWPSPGIGLKLFAETAEEGERLAEEAPTQIVQARESSSALAPWRLRRRSG